jgi:hypothetical protein
MLDCRCGGQKRRGVVRVKVSASMSTGENLGSGDSREMGRMDEVLGIGGGFGRSVGRSVGRPVLTYLLSITCAGGVGGWKLPCRMGISVPYWFLVQVRLTLSWSSFEPREAIQS